MNVKMTNRHSLSALVIIFYLIPILFFSVYSIQLMSSQKSWMLLSTGLFIAMCGAFLFFFLLYYWEQSFRGQIEHSAAPQFTLSPSSLREEKVAILDSSLLFHSPLSLKQESHEETKEEEPDRALKVNQEEQEKLNGLLESKEGELRGLREENQHLSSRTHQAFQDFADYKLFSEEQLRQKQGQLLALQQIIEDQRAEMEKRQEQIHQLDTKVHDLSYEIKTLLDLHVEEVSPPSSKNKENKENKEEKRVSHYWERLPLEREQEQEREPEKEIVTGSVHTPLEAIYLLKKCIQLAQKMTGAHYYGLESSRYPEFSPSYAIDQRRLFDLLREETAALLLVYSPREDKVLFANSQSKTLLGWSPEKLVADFSFIMQEGLQEWKRVLHAMTSVSETQVRLLAKTRQGQEIVLNGQLGLIPGGLFRGYVIAVFYSD